MVFLAGPNWAEQLEAISTAAAAVLALGAGIVGVWAGKKVNRQIQQAEQHHREDLATQVRPHLSVASARRGRNLGEVLFTVVNVGAGPALRISFELRLIQVPGLAGNEHRLSELLPQLQPTLTGDWTPEITFRVGALGAGQTHERAVLGAPDPADDPVLCYSVRFKFDDVFDNHFGLDQHLAHFGIVQRQGTP